MREGFRTGLHPGSMLIEGGMHSERAGGESVRMMGAQLGCMRPGGELVLTLCLVFRAERLKGKSHRLLLSIWSLQQVCCNDQGGGQQSRSRLEL